MKKIIGKVLCIFGLHSWRQFEGVSGRLYRKCRRCPRLKEIRRTTIVLGSGSRKEAPLPKKTIPIKRESKAFDYPNMPVYQPCPGCHKGSKRQEKARGGAKYECPTHGGFFVGGVAL